ncbi:MAG: NADH-quinone oxidoreductase subunit I [Verrucomicrobia bacterium]|nr:NADH-quinone oxidoreductase subunit I [Verrucomicrobiota bacterium]
MPLVVQRRELTLWEQLYFPALLAGFAITLRHFFMTLFGDRRKKVTLEYPEEKWPVPRGYRGAPTLVRDQEGREKCVACQLCEFVCPPRAITIQPGELPSDAKNSKIEKFPEKFQINMLRCIYCGFCEEVCPEQAIFLQQEYSLTGYSREELIHDKQKLFELGGVMEDKIFKWKNK